MVDIVADLHLHSKYSRAVSPQMNLQFMAQVGKQKGLDLLATGDWTHPLWMKELQKQLVESEEGLFQIKAEYVIPAEAGIQEKSANWRTGSRIKSGMTKERETRFLLSVEIATIFSQGGKGRRIHNLVFVPSFTTAEKVNRELLKRGYNLSSDGRPIIGLSSKHLLELLLEIDERSLLIPAHVWTPWFGVYGQMSGFNSLSEAFEDLAPYVYGIETGLSSDPEMNWQVGELATRSILSFSDAHSAPKMGREATVFRLDELSYSAIRSAVVWPSVKVTEDRKLKIESRKKKENPSSIIDSLLSNRVLYTIEFYPEEGKYHYSGHRKCKVVMTPEEQEAAHGICPVCKRRLTDGVMRRVQELGEKELRIMNYELRGKNETSKADVVWIKDPKHMHPPFVRLVPLQEIIAEAMGRPVASVKVKSLFDTLTKELQSELYVLLHADLSEIAKVAGSASLPQVGAKIAEGVQKVREAQIVIKPGYDGVYGTVKIWNEGKDVAKDTDEPEKDQLGLDL